MGKNPKAVKTYYSFRILSKLFRSVNGVLFESEDLVGKKPKTTKQHKENKSKTKSRMNLYLYLYTTEYISTSVFSRKIPQRTNLPSFTTNHVML